MTIERIAGLLFSGCLHELDRAEVSRCYSRFIDLIPERMDSLGRLVLSDEAMAGWSPDFSVGSLDALGRWFIGQIYTRPRSRDEIDYIRSNTPNYLEVESDDMADSTKMACVDVGMYMGETFIRSYPRARLAWTQEMSDKRNADYGMPVVAGFPVLPLPPVRVVSTVAYGVMRGKRDGGRLRSIFDYWSRDLGVL